MSPCLWKLLLGKNPLKIKFLKKIAIEWAKVFQKKVATIFANFLPGI